MTIGIFGNTNNYPYILATGFQELGIPVKLVVNRPELLHRPESRLPGLSNSYPDWILDCANIPEESYAAQAPEIARVVEFLSRDTKGVLLNNLGPSLHADINRPSIAFLTGSDATYYANYRSAEIRGAVWDNSFRQSEEGCEAILRWRRLVRRQRGGILAARATSFAPRGLVPEGDVILDSIGVPNEGRFFIVMADTIALRPMTPSRNRKTLIVLNGARLNWKKPLPAGFTGQDAKGTDILLRGFASHVRCGGKAELRLVKKGIHVAEAQKLVAELRLDPYVVWLDEMDQFHFIEEMKNADVVCDQLGESFPGMVAVDAMAIGKPVIANFRSNFGNTLPGPMPVFNAMTEEDVQNHLESLAASPKLRKDICTAARDYAEKYLSPEYNAKLCIERLSLNL